MSLAVDRTFWIVAVLVIAGAVVVAFRTIDSPAVQREKRLDEQRLEDLKTIVREIHRLVVHRPGHGEGLKRPLPASLAQAAQLALGQRVPLQDPVTGKPYEYRVLQEGRFSLCAVFNRERTSSDDVFWNHPAGRACFVVDVRDPPPMR